MNLKTVLWRLEKGTADKKRIVFIAQDCVESMSLAADKEDGMMKYVIRTKSGDSFVTEEGNLSADHLWKNLKAAEENQ